VNLELHPGVEKVDLPVIYNFIAGDNPAAAERVLEAIRGTFAQLISQPRIGVSHQIGVRHASGMRMLPVPHFRTYLVFYVVSVDLVRVLYVVQASRDLPEVFALDPRD
jgi:plasmid stabilization system protein ParE